MAVLLTVEFIFDKIYAGVEKFFNQKVSGTQSVLI